MYKFKKVKIGNILLDRKHPKQNIRKKSEQHQGTSSASSYEEVYIGWNMNPKYPPKPPTITNLLNTGQNEEKRTSFP